jgi:hypothetical protein
MDQDLRDIVSRADYYMDKAAAGDAFLGEVVYNSNHAIVLMLGALVSQMDAIQKKLDSK